MLVPAWSQPPLCSLCLQRDTTQAPGAEGAGTHPRLTPTLLGERSCLSTRTHTTVAPTPVIAFTPTPSYALRWAPYLAWLPAALPRLPLFWPLESLEGLAGTAAADKFTGAHSLGDRSTHSLGDRSTFVEPPAQARLSMIHQAKCLTNLHAHAQHKNKVVLNVQRLYCLPKRQYSKQQATLVCGRHALVGKLWQRAWC